MICFRVRILRKSFLYWKILYFLMFGAIELQCEMRMIFFTPQLFFGFFPHSPNFHVQSFKKWYNKMYGFLKKRVLLGNKIDVLPNTHWGKTQFFSPKIIFVKKFTNLRIWILAPKLSDIYRPKIQKYHRKIEFSREKKKNIEK